MVIKSLSKSHGIPGLRLGIAVSGDHKLMDELQQKLPQALGRCTYGSLHIKRSLLVKEIPLNSLPPEVLQKRAFDTADCG